MPRQQMVKPSEADLAAQPLSAADLRLWCKLTGTMITAGVPILETFALAYDALQKPGTRTLSVDAHDGIREGDTMIGAIKATEHGLSEWEEFLRVVDEGEQTGDLDKALLAFASKLKTPNPTDTLNWSSDVKLFTQKFGAAMKEGQPILGSLKLLTADFAGPFGEELKAAAKDIEGGYTLSEALKRNPSSSFDGFCVGMVAAGEAGGILDVTMDLLAEFC